MLMSFQTISSINYDVTYFVLVHVYTLVGLI